MQEKNSNKFVCAVKIQENSGNHFKHQRGLKICYKNEQKESNLNDILANGNEKARLWKTHPLWNGASPEFGNAVILHGNMN